MNAINHAATALLINRKWPGVPIVPVLIAVQLVEFLWVVFNLLGVEVTTTEPQVRALNDIHLAHMPWSHSMASSVLLAVVIWWVASKLLHKPHWGIALGAAVASHILLDLATHVEDIAIIPGINTAKFGLRLYSVPLLALCVETLYGICCWWIFRGSRALLAVIILLNLATLSFYSVTIPGPEQFLAGQTQVFAAAVGVHILIGLVFVGLFARPSWRMSESSVESSTMASDHD